jgi:hypothetical protein
LTCADLLGGSNFSEARPLVASAASFSAAEIKKALTPSLELVKIIMF